LLAVGTASLGRNPSKLDDLEIRMRPDADLGEQVGEISERRSMRPH
jgi:hypothetical protein